VVATIAPDLPLARTLDWQDVDGRLSRVRPVSCPVDPLSRCVRPADALPAGRLQQVGRLLEWAYGYRETVTRGRLTRRAPSAGALYPTETLVVAEDDGGWQVLYYHYGNHRFYRVLESDPAAVARRLRMKAGETCVLCVAVLWRTLQRYGVRGYRYGLLDAAHVAANLARAARTFRYEVAIDPWAPTADLERLLGLEDGEALLLAVYARQGPESLPVPETPVSDELPRTPVVMTEQTPRMCPILERAVRFHRQTLGGPRSRVAWPAGADAPDDWRDVALRRCSAKEFSGAHVSSGLYARMVAVARTPAVIGERTPRLYVYSVTARVWGLPVGVRPLDAEATPSSLPGPTPAGLTQRLAEACQGQVILKPCAFALVIAARTADLAFWGYRGFRPLVLNAGFLCAELYREAARCGLGTTSIGGFSDTAVARLLGDPSLTPIVIQAFGAAAAATEKVDAARLVELPSGNSDDKERSS
jgi:hypothetical protein